MFDDGNEFAESYGSTLVGWVQDKCDTWRDHYDSNYRDKHEEYYRIWRGQWAQEDMMRASERSRIISPATQQAVESSVAEIEEATFGRGRFFDITDDAQDQDSSDIEILRKQLDEDFKKAKVRKGIAETILNSALYGTGMAEITIEETKEMAPATRPVMDGALTSVGVEMRDRFMVKVRAINPQNFLIDPSAPSVEEALGVAIEEFVPRHSVEMLIEDGTYRDEEVYDAAPEYQLEVEKDLMYEQDNRVKLTKYYGLVPRNLFDAEIMEEDEELVELDDDDKDTSGYVEAIVVIANDNILLKVEENPYMMQDRPVIAFPWDNVPSRFWGRGVVEKGYNSQKALDTELRARIDGLALTMHPMMAVDASRLPRGAKMEIRPGKTILTNGNPAEVLQPFRFGEMSQTTFAQAESLKGMVQEATGAVDSQAGFAGTEGTAAGISMSLGSVLKRHKRTLVNFQEQFLIPFIEKSAWRYMQFSPELYPVKDFKFVPETSLGIIAREYEVTQLVQLLQTMGQDSPAYPMMLQSIVDHMNLSNRGQISDMLKQSQQPNPQAEQLQQQERELQVAQIQSQINAFEGQAAESQARANKYSAEIQVDQYRAETDRIKATSPAVESGNADDKEFERRYRTAELMLKEREIESNIASKQAAQAEADSAKAQEAQLMQQLQGMAPTANQPTQPIEQGDI